MPKIAQLHPDATISPTKEELCQRYSPIVERVGSYRAVDPAGEVGLEILIGLNTEGQLVQLPLTYRAAAAGLPTELCTMEHTALGRRSIARGEDDPVAVAEWTRIIEEADGSAEFSTGPQRFTAYGTGPLVGSGSQVGGSAEFLSILRESAAAPGQLRVKDSETGKEYVAARLA